MALAADLGTTPREAERLSNEFKASMPGVDAWLREVVRGCRETEFVETLMRRRRYLPHINAPGPRAAHVRSRAERQAVNTVCQVRFHRDVRLSYVMITACQAVDQRRYLERSWESPVPCALAAVLSYAGLSSGHLEGGHGAYLQHVGDRCTPHGPSQDGAHGEGGRVMIRGGKAREGEGRRIGTGRFKPGWCTR